MTSLYTSRPWGEAYTTSGKDDNISHYAGLEQSENTGILHAQFRDYDSSLGRWLSQDSYTGSYDFTNPQSFNRFNYALGNPVSATDPSGLDVCYLISGGTYSVTSPGGGSAGADPEVYVCTGDPSSGGGGYGGGYAGGYGGGTGNSAPNNITCSTVLPNGKTVGDYVRTARSSLNSVPGTGSPPLDAYNMLTAFKAQVGGGSAIDFMNTMSGQASQEFLGNAGNFAYYAIGSGYFSPVILDVGAGGYAIKSAFIPSSPVKFSSLTMPYGQDTSAKLEEGPGLAANGCGVKTF